MGIDSTDVLNFRKKLNEEVVGGEAGIKFLKQELKKIIIDKPIKDSGKEILFPQKGKQIQGYWSKWSW